MTLVAEDGTARSDADAYCDTAFADAYHSDRSNTAWAALTTGQKEVALRKATDYMGAAYTDRWAGYRRTLTQALDWPRQSVPRRDSPVAYQGSMGFMQAYYDPETIPFRIKQACAELALRSLSQELLPDTDPPVSSESVGPISVSYQAGASQLVRFNQVDYLLQPLLRSSSFVGRAARA